MKSLPRVLMLGQYPLTTLDSAPQVRTHAMWQALQRHAEVTFVTGTRASRRLPLLKLLATHRLKDFDCVYLEAATSTSMEVDLLLLTLLKQAGLPIGIYIRDAYPLFDLTPTQRFKEKLLLKAWYVSQWWYRQVAAVLFFPSRQLADCFVFPRRECLMPAGDPSRLPAPATGPFRYILFAGRLEAVNGWIHLKAAMEIVYARFPQVRLLALTTLTPPGPLPPWLEIRRGQLDAVLPELAEIACGVVPRPHNTYNDLAIPLKTMDYLGLGLPLVTTRCRALAELVEHDQLGLTCEDTPESLAENLCLIFERPLLRQQLADQARRAFLAKHTWDHRAQHVLSSLLGTA
ncbi:MAG: glycosyltransferase family 4 protein [Candidatus Sericytochromatia bacterium]